MPIVEEMVPSFVCSDGARFADEHDAAVHEAWVELKKVCDEHGYSGPSFSRDFLFEFLTSHAADFAPVLSAYADAHAARFAGSAP